MPVVSIIVPVYNAEKYLGYCINSILNQQFRDFELILVNDGSTDSSLKICNNYADIDKRVKVIDIINQGVSNARNTGIKQAKGEYIQFVDADDLIMPEMTQGLLSIMQTYHKDLVVCSFTDVDLSEEVPKTSKIGLYCDLGEQVYDYDNLFKNLFKIVLETSLIESPWNKLFKRNIIIENNIKFKRELSMGEDFLFNLKYLSCSNGVVLISQPYYYYVRRQGEGLMAKTRLDMLPIMMMLENELYLHVKKHHKLSQKEEEYLYIHYVSRIIFALQNYCNITNEVQIAEAKTYIAEALNDKLIQKALSLETHHLACYTSLKESALKHDVIGVLTAVRSSCCCNSTEKPDIEWLRNPANWGKSKKACMKCINAAKKACKNNSLKLHKISVMEDYLIRYGVKATMKKIIKK